MLKNVIAYAKICSMYARMCEFLDMQHMRHNFCICDFKDAIICGEICTMRVLAKYAIAYSHVTSISC